MTQYVYRFGGGVSDGGKGDRNLLGGKGANLESASEVVRRSTSAGATSKAPATPPPPVSSA